MTLIRVEGVRYGYSAGDEKVEVLRGIDLTVGRGEFLGLYGPSGSGKSTLFHLLGALLKPTAGKILFDGVDLGKLNDAGAARLRNQRIGFIFQQFHLLPRATVLENILLPSRYPLQNPAHAGHAWHKALFLAQHLGLDERLNHSPSQLSGGQQQRVAICRALLRDVDLILADEPTGNLDSLKARETMQLLSWLNGSGKTVILITHDPGCLRYCDRVVHLQDGVISREEIPLPDRRDRTPPFDIRLPQFPLDKAGPRPGVFRSSLRASLENLNRNRTRSALTMLGIVIGIASLLSVLTLGDYAKRKLLAGYERLGVNKIQINGYRNSMLKAEDKPPRIFDGFNYTTDLEPLKRVFSEISLVSPLRFGTVSVAAGGLTLEEHSQLVGVSPEFLEISSRALLVGRNLSAVDIAERRRSCLIGSDIHKKLFGGEHQPGEVLSVETYDKTGFVCRVVGVLAEVKGTNQMLSNNLVVIPHTYDNGFVGRSSFWAMVQVAPGHDVEDTGRKILAFLRNRYGASGQFSVNRDSNLIAQMKRFLNTFTMLLGAVAVVSLVVGGLGICNMILASVTERLREIGLRRAIGARRKDIFNQVILESAILGAVGGVIGLVTGYLVSEAMILGASRFIPQMPFEWVVNPAAVILSVLAIFLVAILAGLAPALQTSKIEIAEALRSE